MRMRVRAATPNPRHAEVFSWATPIITTPKRPSRSALRIKRRATSSLDSPFLKCTTGILCLDANRSIARTYAEPIFPSAAGEGIGKPRSNRKRTTIPSD